jgi:hypothetical protein
MAQIGRDNGEGDWQIAEAVVLRNKTIEKFVPGLLEEVFCPEKTHTVWSRGPRGLLRPYRKIIADGPLLNAYLTVFAAKMGMALYHVDNRTRVFGAPLVVGVFQHLSRGCWRRSEIARNPQTSQSGFEPAVIWRLSGGICLISLPLVCRFLTSREKVGHGSGRK